MQDTEKSITRIRLLSEAARRGWTVKEFGAGLAPGSHAYFCKVIHPDGRWELFRGSQPMRNSANGVIISRNKHLTMEFINELGYGVPPYIVVSGSQSDEDIAAGKRFLEEYGRIVAKPSDATQSNGVTINITSPEALTRAATYARQFTLTDKVVLQKQLTGSLYRVFLINNSVAAAALRKAPQVVGDGHKTVEALIADLNANPRRGSGRATPLKTIKLDHVAQEFGQDFLANIPAEGEVVKVSALDSVSAGGEAIDVTPEVHPKWGDVLGNITTQMGLFVCGFDIMTESLTIPPDESELPILELNSMPGTKLHLHPTGGGEAVDVVSMILDALFPE